MRSTIVSALSVLAVVAAAYPTDIQTSISNTEILIQQVINDLAQQQNAFSDYSTTGRSLTSLQRAITDNCPLLSLPAPATSSAQAIAYLQQVQLDLQILSQDIINGDTTAATNEVCAANSLYAAAAGFISSSSGGSSLTTSTTVGSSSTITSGPTSSISPFACNPAHSYPYPVTCIIVSGTPSFSTIPTTTATITSSSTSSTPGFACNPAHSYPYPVTCVFDSTGPVFSTLPTSTTTPTSTATITSTTTSTAPPACNPAHSYPYPVTCVFNSTGPVFSTLPTSTSASTSTSTSTSTIATAPSSATTFACNPAHSYPSPVTCVFDSTGPVFSTLPTSTATVTTAI